MRAFHLLVLILVWLSLNPGGAKAQNNRPETITLEKAYGGAGEDVAQNAILLPDNGLLLHGSSNSSVSGDKTEDGRGGFDFWAVRLDAEGEIVWDKTFGGAALDELRRAVPAPDGGFLLAGWSSSGASGDKSEDGRGGWDYWVVRIDQDGELLWEKTFGGALDDQLMDATAVDGGYILTGHSPSGVSGEKSEEARGEWDYWLVKIDDQGDILWDKTYGGAGTDQVAKTIELADGGLLVHGYSDSGVSGEKSEAGRGQMDYWILRTDANGDIVWDKTYGGSGQDQPWTLLETADGQFLVGGHSDSGASGDKTEAGRGQFDYWFLMLDADGELVWDRTVGGAGRDVQIATWATNYGFATAGYSNSGQTGDKTEPSRGGNDFWAVGLGADGEVLWDKTYGGQGEDLLRGMAVRPDGELLLSGTTNSGPGGDKTSESNGRTDYWLLRAAPGLSAGPDTAFCGPGVALLRGSSGLNNASFRWEPAALVENPGQLETRTLALEETTTFTLTATLSDNSQISDSATVAVAESGLFFRLLNKRDAKEASQDGAIVASAAGGSAPYVYRLNQDEFTAGRIFRGLAPGAYLVEARDDEGCVTSKTVTIR